MKESITKFDLEAAFKALDDIDTPVAEKGIKANKPALTEIFSRKSKFDVLFEEYYDIGSTEELSDAKEAREAEVAKAKLARIEKIVDLDAESPDDLLTSYVGKFIIQCPQCMTLFYKNPEDVEESEDDPATVNVNEVCQHCGNESGYTLVGKVGEATSEDEFPEEPSMEASEEGELLDDEASEEDTNTEGSEDTEVDIEDFDLDSELEDLDLEIEDDEVDEEKKEESFITHTGEVLVEDIQDDKELDTKLEAHNEYIEYLRTAIAQEEATLEKTDNEQVKAAIQRRIDAFKADLESALPDEVKNNLATAEESEDLDLEIEDPEKTVIKEALKEGTDLDISASEFEQLISSPEFKKPMTDRAARAMMQEFEESITTEKNETDLLAAFDNCNYEVIDAGYTKSDDIIVTLNHNVSDVNEAAEHLKQCLEQAGINQIFDWNTNGQNVFIFSVDTQKALEEAPVELKESPEEIEDYQLVFEPTADAKDEDLTNTLCDTVSKIGVKYHSAKKLAGKYHINILGSVDDLQAAKVTIENSGFFKTWLKDAQLASSYDNNEKDTENLEEGIFDKFKDKFANVIDKVTSSLKSREAKADWILKNARENYDNTQVSNEGALVPDEKNQRFHAFIVIGFRNRYSNGKLITMAPSFSNKDLVIGKNGVQVKKNYKDADNIAKGWSMDQNNGPAFIYLAKNQRDDKAVFLCEYFKGDLEYDQLDKYFEVVKKNLKASKLTKDGGMSQDEEDQSTDVIQELAASKLKRGMKVKISTEVGEITSVGKSKLKAGNLALRIKFANNKTETISVDPDATIAVVASVKESLVTKDTLDNLMQNIDELNEATLEKLISSSLVEAYQNVAGFRLTNCAYLNEQFTVDGTIYFTSGKLRKTTYTFTEAYTEDNKINLRGLNEKLGLDKQFTITGITDTSTKTFIAESFNSLKK